MIAAGCGFAASGVTSKLLADALASGDAAAALGWGAATAAVAGLAMVDDMAALQRILAARAAAGAFALETAIPVLLAPLVVGEAWSATPLGGGAILAALALVLGGALALGSTPAVSALAGPLSSSTASEAAGSAAKSKSRGRGAPRARPSAAASSGGPAATSARPQRR